MEARHQIGDGGLAGAAPAHQGVHRSAGRRQAERAHHGTTLAVFELHVFETDFFHGGRRIDGVRPVGLVDLHRQDFEDALHGGERALQFGECVDDVPYRIQQLEAVPLERHDVADGSPAAQVQEAAEPDDGHIDYAHQQVPGGPYDSLAPLGEHFLPQDGMAAAHKFEQFVYLAAKGADYANARKCLAHAAVDLLSVLAHRPVDGPDALGEDEADHHDTGHDRQRRQGQTPVQRSENREGGEQPDDRYRRRDEGHL